MLYNNSKLVKSSFRNISKLAHKIYAIKSPFQIQYFINHKQRQSEYILVLKIPKNIYLKIVFLHISKLMS